MTKKKDEGSKSSNSLIDENLKRIYDDVVNEDIPDRFKDLLAKLKKQEDGVGEAK